jgi:hypothetical protein
MRRLAILLPALLLLVSCGDDDTTDASDSTTTTGLGGTATTADSATSSTGSSTSTSGETTTTGDKTTTTATTTTTDGPIGGGPYPVADVTVTVTHPDRDDVTYRITCFGDTATVTGDDVDIDEREACRALADPDVVERLTVDPGRRICTQQYGGPDEATFSGTIDGEAVEASVDRRDGCGIADWDLLLADLLPPPVGQD